MRERRGGREGGVRVRVIMMVGYGDGSGDEAGSVGDEG